MKGRRRDRTLEKEVITAVQGKRQPRSAYAKFHSYAFSISYYLEMMFRFS